MAFVLVRRALVFPENFQHILRVMNTNIEGQRKIMYALTSIKGCGRRYANLCCKKAEIDLAKRAGELVRRAGTGAGWTWPRGWWPCFV